MPSRFCDVMTADFIYVLHFVFSTCWRLFTSWHIPGTNVTPASWGMFALVLAAVVTYLKRVGTGGDGSD